MLALVWASTVSPAMRELLVRLRQTLGEPGPGQGPEPGQGPGPEPGTGAGAGVGDRARAGTGYPASCSASTLTSRRSCSARSVRPDCS